MSHFLSSFARERLLKFAFVLIAVYSALKSAGFFEILKEHARRAKLMRAMPGPGRDKEHWLLGGHGYVMRKHLRAEKLSLNPGNMAKVMVSAMVDLSAEYPNEQLVRMYGASSSVPTNLAGLVLVTGLEAAKEMLSAKRQVDFVKGMAYEVSEELIGKSVLHESGEAWARQRPAMEKGMTHKLMENSLHLVIKTANELGDVWDSPNGQVVDVRVDMLKLTMDVIGRVAFGTDFGSATVTKIEDAPLYLPFDTILKTLEHRALLRHEHYLRFLPTSTNLKFYDAMSRLDGQVDDILEKRLNARKGGSQGEPQDLLDVLLQGHSIESWKATEDSNDRMPIKIVKDNVKTSLFAGHDTTGALLAWFFYTMAAHPDVQKRLRAEIVAALGPNGDPTYQQVEELAFLNACVLEVMRLYPSAGFTRKPVHDTVVEGVTIPAQTEILFLPYVLQRNPKYWPNPNSFDPERMLTEGLIKSTSGFTAAMEGRMEGEDESKSSNRVDSLQSRIARISAKKAFFPFSLGPRSCVGRPLALLETRVVIIKLLQRFSFEVTDDPEFREVPLLLMTLNPASIKLLAKRIE